MGSRRASAGDGASHEVPIGARGEVRAGRGPRAEGGGGRGPRGARSARRGRRRARSARGEVRAAREEAGEVRAPREEAGEGEVRGRRARGARGTTFAGGRTKAGGENVAPKRCPLFSLFSCRRYGVVVVRSTTSFKSNYIEAW